MHTTLSVSPNGAQRVDHLRRRQRGLKLEAIIAVVREPLLLTSRRPRDPRVIACAGTRRPRGARGPPLALK